MSWAQACEAQNAPMSNSIETTGRTDIFQNLSVISWPERIWQPGTNSSGKPLRPLIGPPSFFVAHAQHLTVRKCDFANSSDRLPALVDRVHGHTHLVTDLYGLGGNSE